MVQLYTVELYRLPHHKNTQTLHDELKLPREILTSDTRYICMCLLDKLCVSFGKIACMATGATALERPKARFTEGGSEPQVPRDLTKPSVTTQPAAPTAIDGGTAKAQQQQPSPEEKAPPRILYGETLEHDLRIAKISAREKFLLSVIIPRIRSTRDALSEWCSRSAKKTVWIPCTVILVLQLGMVGVCVLPQCSFLCAYGPTADDDDDRSSYAYAFADYGPPMINVLASLMLSFYANVCMGLYKEGYLAAQTLKSSVIDLMTMVVGTIPPEYPAIRTEFWRCVNLFHLCSYVLADKSRGTYNVDNFLLPVATAYGEHDGEQHFGMLQLDEVSALSASPHRI